MSYNRRYRKAPSEVREAHCKRDHDPKLSKWNGYSWVCSPCQVVAHADQKARDPEARVRANERQRERRRKIRQRVIEAYGGQCACPGCHVTDPRKLTIDHINGNGAEHKAANGNQHFYEWIVRNGFPDDLQLLCWTCNAVKFWYPGEICCPV